MRTAVCGLGTQLQGISVDTGGSPGALYVTDGNQVYYVDALTGAAGPSRFYSSSPCYFTSAGRAIMGLKGTSFTIGFGSPSGGQNPLSEFNGFPGIGAKGQSVVPIPEFRIEVGGAGGRSGAGHAAAPGPG